jgi:hypothetical protein
MTSLLEDQRFEIRRHLGYPPESLGLVLPELAIDYPDPYIDRITAILTELSEIGDLKRQARRDSMSVELEGLKLNYAQHVAHLERSERCLVRELASIVGEQPYWARGGDRAESVAIQYQ